MQKAKAKPAQSTNPSCLAWLRFADRPRSVLLPFWTLDQEKPTPGCGLGLIVTGSLHDLVCKLIGLFGININTTDQIAE